MDTALAREIKGRVTHHFIRAGWCAITEYTLPNRRRLDVVAITPNGAIVGVETKIAEGDLRQDIKWTDYIRFVNAFYFAIPSTLPMQFVNTMAGLIISEPKKFEIKRESQAGFVDPAIRDWLAIDIAREASYRLACSAEWREYHRIEKTPTKPKPTAPSTAIRNAAFNEAKE